MTTHMPRVKFTVEQYERMGEAGILREDDRVELIEGEIVRMSPVGHRHMACVKRLNALLHSTVERLAIVSVQDPVQLSDLSEPQPDVALLRWRDDFYALAKPQAKDVLLVIEVAETWFLFDRDEKIPRYAEAGIPEALLVDLNGEQVVYYARPAYGVYQVIRQYRRGETVQFEAVSGLALAVNDILG